MMNLIPRYAQLAMLGAAQMMDDPNDKINSCDMVWLCDQGFGSGFYCSALRCCTQRPSYSDVLNLHVACGTC